MSGLMLNTRSKKIAAALIAAVVLVGLIVAVLWATNTLGWRRWRIQEAAAFTGAAVPADATDVQFATQDEQARIVWLHFTLSDDEGLADYLAAMGIESGLREGFTPFPGPNPVEAPLEWWTPYSAAVYRGVYINRGDKIIEVLADDSAPGMTVVYVRAYAL